MNWILLGHYSLYEEYNSEDRREGENVYDFIVENTPIKEVFVHVGSNNGDIQTYGGKEIYIADARWGVAHPYIIDVFSMRTTYTSTHTADWVVYFYWEPKASDMSKHRFVFYINKNFVGQNKCRFSIYYRNR